MRNLFFFSLIAVAALVSCTTDQIETTNDASSLQLDIEQVTTQNDTPSTRNLNGGMNVDPDISRIDCIENAVCELSFLPTADSGPSYRELHIWYDTDLKLEEVDCLRNAYFHCFAGDLWMRTTQPNSNHHDIWLEKIGKPDNGLGSTTDDDPRVCNNPTGSCD